MSGYKVVTDTIEGKHFFVLGLDIDLIVDAGIVGVYDGMSILFAGLR